VFEFINDYTLRSSQLSHVHIDLTHFLIPFIVILGKTCFIESPLKV